MERLDGAGLQEVPEEARSLTSRAAGCQSAIRRVESPLCFSHARQGLTSRHGFTPKRVNRVNAVTTRTPSNIRTAVPKTTVRGAGHSAVSLLAAIVPLLSAESQGVESTRMNDDALVKSVMEWERESFRKVSGFPPESPTRAIALGRVGCSRRRPFLAHGSLLDVANRRRICYALAVVLRTCTVAGKGCSRR